MKCMNDSVSKGSLFNHIKIWTRFFGRWVGEWVGGDDVVRWNQSNQGVTTGMLCVCLCDLLWAPNPRTLEQSAKQTTYCSLIMQTMHSSRIIQISVMKSRSSILTTSNRRRFQPVLGSCNHSASFQLWQSQETTAACCHLKAPEEDEVEKQEVPASVAASKEISLCSALAAVLSVIFSETLWSILSQGGQWRAPNMAHHTNRKFRAVATCLNWQ